MKRWMAILIVLLGAANVGLAEGWEAGILTNASTNMLEPRAGVQLSDEWTVGVLGLYYEPDLAGEDWGVGCYAKMAVDPNATFALADWLPAGLGGFLPAEITAATYGIGRVIYTDADGEGTFSASIGAGAQVGPAVLEAEYAIVESGETDDPVAVSGLEVKFGLMIEF